MGNIIRDGVLLTVYEFTVLIIYIVISSPVSLLIASLTTAGTSAGVSQMAAAQTEVNAVLNICFGLLALIPGIWFIFRVFQREPDWGYR